MKKWVKNRFSGLIQTDKVVSYEQFTTLTSPLFTELSHFSTRASAICRLVSNTYGPPPLPGRLALMVS